MTQRQSNGFWANCILMAERVVDLGKQYPWLTAEEIYDVLMQTTEDEIDERLTVANRWRAAA